ncbi:protein of unknown function DUF1296 domain containing protein [Klebsormidium nitens]|uniref:GBF-interacting protein 1 N-terminal domain-containing protein n=1 Tax=Klebsormidium nitens TaxID=105231 RepID=A0A0U9HJR2_KLENI|nr:protein of unknown function DUF1296 domain containing protein [Klebsormidium nitens]|eukprot:GAQ83038.1 protein of unknown function DUF1296 domain containing protein [Klebsormidium nitens]
MSKPGAASAKPALAGGIPQSAKKFVQSVKEIVPSADEDQIYTELKACGMDPNEAVQRLLNQDPFVDVKRKKKIKETPAGKSPAQEGRPRAPVGGGSFRGGRGGGISGGLDRPGSGRGGFASRPGSGDTNGVRRPPPARENGIHPRPPSLGGAPQPAAGQQKHTFAPAQGGAPAAAPPAAPPSLLPPAFSSGASSLPGTGQSGLAAGSGVAAPGGEPQRPLYSRGPMAGGWGSSGSTLADIVKGHQQQQQQPSQPTVSTQQTPPQTQPQSAPQPASSPSPQPPPTPPQYTPASALAAAPSSPPSGVYSSATDPVLHPSFDARAPGGGIKRELGTVGTQRPISKDRGMSYESSLPVGGQAGSPPSTSDLGGSIGESSISGGQSAPVASPIVPPPMPQERPLLQSDVSDGAEDARAPGRSVGVTSQYGSRPAYQPQAVSKAPSSGLEWKPKAPGPNLPNSIGSSPVASEPMNRPTSPPQSAVAAKLESLSIQPQQEEKPVILPGHLQVSEADRTRLSFGSFGAGFGGFGESVAPPKAATSGAQQHVPSSISATSQAYSQHPSSSIAPPSSVAESSSLPPSSTSHSEAAKHDGTSSLHQAQQYPQYPGYPGFSGVGLPHLSSQYPYDIDSQGSEATRLSSFSTPYGEPTSNFYASFRPQSETETKYSGLGSAASASSKYGASATSTGASSQSQEAAASSSSGTSGQSSQAGITGASPPGGGFAAQQPLPLHAYAQSNLPPGAYQYPHFYPMHPPNYMYNPYSHSPYATPGNSGYPQGPAGGNYPPGAGGSYPPVGGVSTSVKYPSGPYKPGTTAGGAPGASAYGGYGAGPGGYGGAPAVSSANATGYEDLSASQYKESNLYIPGQQGLSRDVQAAPTSSYYNIPGGNQHYAQQGHHGGYGGGLYHPSQSGPSQAGHQYPQQAQSQQPLSGGAGAGAAGSGGYQNQRGGNQQQSWNY